MDRVAPGAHPHTGDNYLGHQYWVAEEAPQSKFQDVYVEATGDAVNVYRVARAQHVIVHREANPKPQVRITLQMVADWLKQNPDQIQQFASQLEQQRR